MTENQTESVTPSAETPPAIEQQTVTATPEATPLADAAQQNVEQPPAFEQPPADDDDQGDDPEPAELAEADRNESVPTEAHPYVPGFGVTSKFPSGGVQDDDADDQGGEQ